jgi:GNAT superfamily N-acetyltransferase
MSDVDIRLATVVDIPVIAGFRRAMFVDMGETDSAACDAMALAFEAWAREKMGRGDYMAWLAEVDGSVVASVGLWRMEWSPLPHDLSNRRGRVMDVYTQAGYRRLGLARVLMTALVSWSRAQGLHSLHLDASAMGRGLYEELGFENTNEMRLKL